MIGSRRDAEQAVTDIALLGQAILEAEDSEPIKLYLEAIERKDTLEAALKDYVLRSKSGEFEANGVRVARQSNKFFGWNADKLRELLPPRLWKRIVDEVPNDEKIDALVREGKLDPKLIQPAYEVVRETKAFARISGNGNSAERAADEAARVEDALA